MSQHNMVREDYRTRSFFRKHVAERIGRFYRRHSYRRKRVESAVKIQKVFRGYQVRDNVKWFKKEFPGRKPHDVREEEEAKEKAKFVTPPFTRRRPVPDAPKVHRARRTGLADKAFYARMSVGGGVTDMVPHRNLSVGGHRRAMRLSKENKKVEHRRNVAKAKADLGERRFRDRLVVGAARALANKLRRDRWRRERAAKVYY